MADLTLAAQHADKYWAEICEDGKVITKERVIVIKDEYKNFGISPDQWKAVFLKYDTGAVRSEGLFFVPTNDSRTTLAVRNLNGFHEAAFDNPVDRSPGWKFICSWRDSGKDNLRFGIVPLYTGLNDCAHFVSECLAKAGLKVASTDVNKLLENIAATGKAKTLAQLTDKERAGRILQSGIMKPGDVLAFGKAGKGHKHSALYLGDEKIAMHTYINHPDLINNLLVKQNPATGKKTNWETAANDAHPLVTLVHFSYDDLLLLNSPRFGWWKVEWRGQNYFYYFDKNGRAGYIKQKPKNTKQPPLYLDGSGFWFELGTNLVICWTATGNLEVFSLIQSGHQMTGTWNDNEKLVAERI